MTGCKQTLANTQRLLLEFCRLESNSSNTPASIPIHSLCQVQWLVDDRPLDGEQMIYPTQQNGTRKWVCLDSILVPVCVEHACCQMAPSRVASHKQPEGKAIIIHQPQSHPLSPVPSLSCIHQPFPSCIHQPRPHPSLAAYTSPSPTPITSPFPSCIHQPHPHPSLAAYTSPALT